MMVQSTSSKQSIILFDGVCNLCHSAVQFVLKRDPQENFLFASLQSETGQRLLREHGLPTGEMNSFILLDRGKVYTQSTAGLHVVKRLKGLWPILYLLIIVPKPLRDVLYNLIANNRYRWFGKKEACLIPTPDLRRRFLED